MGEIYLIRHGQASFGEQNYDRLSPTGITQSRRLGDWLRETGLSFDAIYSGERERQRDTARLALEACGAADCDPAIDPSFNELDADRLLQYAIPRLVLRDPSIAPLLMNIKGNRDAFRHLFEGIVDEWVSGGWEDAGIGNWGEFSSRVIDGLEAIARRHGTGQRVAVFTSGGPITVAMKALDGERRGGLDWKIANTSITRLSFNGEGALQLVERRVIPHLEPYPDLLTHL